jgi:hypothetical protein
MLKGDVYVPATSPRGARRARARPLQVGEVPVVTKACTGTCVLREGRDRTVFFAELESQLTYRKGDGFDSESCAV